MKDVFTKEFRAWIDDIDAKMIAKQGGQIDDERRLLTRTVKLSEEVGELSEAVLSSLNDQRQAKLDHFEKRDLDTEIADVIITALIIARSTNTDIDDAIITKLETIKKRADI